MTEDALLMLVTALCDDSGVLWFHSYDSRRDRMAGYPDLTLVGSHSAAFRELKTDHGSLTPDQVTWRYVLVAAGADWGMWTPADWRSGRIAREIAGLVA